MDNNTLDTIILMKYMPTNKISVVEDMLKLNEGKAKMALSLNYRNPTTMIFISIFFGSWGIDRFSIGSIGIGLVKLIAYLASLLSYYVIFIDQPYGFEVGWLVIPIIQPLIWLIDCFCIHSATKSYNYNKFLKFISQQSRNSQGIYSHDNQTLNNIHTTTTLRQLALLGKDDHMLYVYVGIFIVGVIVFGPKGGPIGGIVGIGILYYIINKRKGKSETDKEQENKLQVSEETDKSNPETEP